MTPDDQEKLQQALKGNRAINPLEEVKAIRKEQLDRCAIKRSEEIKAIFEELEATKKPHKP